MELQRIANGMLEAARKHPNDVIANAMSRVGDQILTRGAAYVKKMNKTDRMVYDYYVAGVIG